jgi:para-aminobenzoate synthetase component 1
VTGTLKKDKTALDLLKSCFPGGSITGAPKIRAMEIIEELEKTRRGPYCGAMGYIGFDGNMDTNIIIRTLIHANGKAYLQTGSGIVSDSIPEKELQEGLDKAQKIFESFETKDQEDVA